MDCGGLCNAMFLDVACNRLSSLQGLKDTQQLLELNLSENRLTRIGKFLCMCNFFNNVTIYTKVFGGHKFVDFTVSLLSVKF